MLMARGTRIAEGGGEGALGEIVCRRLEEMGGQGQAATAVQLTETGHSEMGSGLEAGGFMWRGAEAQRVQVQTQQLRGAQVSCTQLRLRGSLSWRQSV